MDMIFSALFAFAAVGSVSLQSYFLIKQKETKIFSIQLGLLIMAILLGILKIYHISFPSIAKLLVMISPW